jgi:DNA polymerase sigma
MSTFTQVVQDVVRRNMSEAQKQQMFVVILVLTLAAFLPSDHVQLCIAVFGAFMYVVMRPVHPTLKKQRAESYVQAPNQRFHRAGYAAPQRAASYPKQRGGRPQQCSAQVSYRPEVKRVSRHPVMTHSFQSKNFDEQVEELLTQIEPDFQSLETVDKIVDSVRRYVHQILPDSKVAGFCHARVTRATAFGVAVPEVDVVVTSSRQELSDLQLDRLPKNMDRPVYLNVRGLQKSATRAIADRLVAAAGFKFRRSGFKCDEPKVTIMAPSFGPGDPVPVDLSINSKVPLYNAAIIEECAAMEPRSRLLVLLVKRWAKDRGICHAAKGHLPPYGWTLLVMYFLQVGNDDEPFLPLLQNCNLLTRVHKLAETGVRENTSTAAESCLHKRAALEVSVGELFSAFFCFYTSINWNEEVASVRLGRKVRSRPESSNDPLKKKGPRIEDPFECGRNIAEIMNEITIERFHEELARGKELLSDGAGLDEITQPWEPPERPED